MKRVVIIGSHGLYASYGGWDQLVNNFAERKSEDIEYLIFNSVESPNDLVTPRGVTVKRLRLKASGFQGLFYDFWSILISFSKADTFLLLGIQGIPILPFLLLFRKCKVVTNVGGIEWERPKFGFFARQYLRLCFRLGFLFSDYIVLDNLFFIKYVPKRSKAEIKVIPYGGEIDESLKIGSLFKRKYPFLMSDYVLSISRPLEDNLIDELCESFLNSSNQLVLISNISSSAYGRKIYEKYCDLKSIIFIDGLYHKPELDLIRRNCKAYIHTHTLCGTAPSLVEMIVAQRPIFSIDIPQNRFTLKDQACFYNDFSEIHQYLDTNEDLSQFIPSLELSKSYNWDIIVKAYEALF